MEIVFATRNKGKIVEIKEILKGTVFEAVSMDEAGISLDVTEDGETYEENALKKAQEIMKVCGKIVLADDSGLEVDFLDKAPGVYSARYLGEDTPYSVKNQVILEKLHGVPQSGRTARFVSVIAASLPGIGSLTCRACIEGVIHDQAAGENGFGYDPIFYVPEYGMTTAQMPMELKNKISHRGKALRDMRKKLEEIYGARV